MRIHFGLKQRKLRTTLKKISERKGFIDDDDHDDDDDDGDVGAEKKMLFVCTVQIHFLIENRDAVYSCCYPSHLTYQQQTPKKTLESLISNWKTTQYFFSFLYFYHSFVCLFVCSVLLQSSCADTRYFDRLSPVTNSSLIIRFQAVEMNCNLEMMKQPKKNAY